MEPTHSENRNDDIVKNLSNKNTCKCCNSDDNDVKFFKVNDLYSKRISDPEKLIKVERNNRKKLPTRNMRTETRDLDIQGIRHKSLDSIRAQNDTKHDENALSYYDLVNQRKILKSHDNHKISNGSEIYNYKPSYRKQELSNYTVRFNKNKPKYYEYESDVWESDIKNCNVDDSKIPEKTRMSMRNKLKRPKSADVRKKTRCEMNDCEHYHRKPMKKDDSYIHYLNDMQKYADNYNERRKHLRRDVGVKTKKKDETEPYDSDEYEIVDAKVNRTKSSIKWETKLMTTSNYHKNCFKENKTKIKNKKKPKKVIESSKESRKKFINTCYCTKTSKQPLVSSNNSLVRYKKDYERMGMNTCTSMENFGKTKLKKATKGIRYVPESKFLRRFQEDLNDGVENENGLPLQYTKQRDALEKAYEVLSYDDQPECYDYKGHMRGGSDGPYESKSTLYDSADTMSERISHHKYDLVPEKINNVHHIRNENFFDTHSTVDLTDNDYKHNCFYKYELDDRQIPKPLNPDVYGTNRCVICKKAYTGKEIPNTVIPKSTYSKRNYNWTPQTTKQTVNTKSVANFFDNSKELSEVMSKDSLVSSSFVPTFKRSSSFVLNDKIVTNDDDTVEMKLPKTFNKLLSETKTLKFRPVINPQNTYALRYQKGVL